MRTVENAMKGVEQHADIDIVQKNVTVHLRKMLNWKAPDPDGLQGFW